MSQFFNKVFLKYQCGFQKSINMEQCLLALLEKWKKSVDNEKTALLANLVKVFDPLDYELLITKLNTYSFGLPVLFEVEI